MLLAGQKQSGQSVPAYCSARGVSCSSYYRWQKLLKNEEQPELLFSPIEIEVKGPGGVVVELPGGVVVRFAELPPVDYLCRLSGALRAGDAC